AAGQSSQALINISGTATVSLTGSSNNKGIDLAFTTGNSGGYLNLNGGTLITTYIRATTTGSPAYLSFNGGKLPGNSGTATYINNLTAARIYAGGATINTNGFNPTIPQVLSAPTGSGVISITVSNGGTGYVGPPAVRITDSTGTGASAIAVVDLTPGS